MALSFRGPLNVPNYTALSTDIADNKIPGPVYPVQLCFLRIRRCGKLFYLI